MLGNSAFHDMTSNRVYHVAYMERNASIGTSVQRGSRVKQMLPTWIYAASFSKNESAQRDSVCCFICTSNGVRGSCSKGKHASFPHRCQWHTDSKNLRAYSQCCIHESSVEEMDPIVECLAHLSLHKVVYLDYLPPPLLLDYYSSHPAPNLILVPPPSHLSLGHAAELVGSDPLAGRSR